MVKISRLAALQGKPKKYKIGDTELELKPLTVDELELFTIDEKASVEEQMKSSKALITKVLKNSIQDATDEEIKNVSLEHLQPLMNAIMDLHKLSADDSRTQKIKEKIQARKDAIKVRQDKGESNPETGK